MQIFLPFPDIKKSLEVLDKQRSGKQRVEARQIIDIIAGKKTGGYSNHPCVKMYRNHLHFLITYYNQSLVAFKNKGGNNVKLLPLAVPYNCSTPPWLGNEDFHKGHQSNLLRKAMNDMNGISVHGTTTKAKKRSCELLNNLGSFGIYPFNTPIDLPYIWGDL